MLERNAIVIGSGIGGLACAIRLACKGYQVTVIEQNDYLGGKLSVIEQNGFRFDAGPSLLTMPHLIDELFTLAGKTSSLYFPYQKLTTVCHYFFEDGTVLHAPSDPSLLPTAIEKAWGEPKENVEKYLRNSAKIYDITHKVFLERSLHKIKSYLHWDTFRSILRLPQIDLMRSMHQASAGFFVKAKTQQFFDRYATYNGSNPYKAPATLHVIPSFEYHFGAYFPKYGMHQITNSLAELGKSLSITYRLKTRVKQIYLNGNGDAGGVLLDEGLVTADIVVSNTDMYHTYQALLKDVKAPKKRMQQERSSSGLVFYWGIKGTFPELDLHNIFFAQEYALEFKALFEDFTIADDPTVYLNISSKKKPDDAPAGHENWFVMVNAPENKGQDWDKLLEKTKDNILKKLSKILKTDIGSLIVSESILDPRDIENKTSSFGGSLYGTASNHKMSAFFRHPNFSSDIDHLYFVGGSVHPGGGIPLCLLSAKIVADLVPNT